MTTRAIARSYVNPRGALAALIVAAVFGVGVIVGHVSTSVPLHNAPASAAQPGSAPTSVAHVAPILGSVAETSVYADYRRLVADLALATARHDARAVAEYRVELKALLTPAVIETIHKEYASILANLQTANNRHDARAAAEFRQQLSGLCGPAVTQAYVEFCVGP